MNRSDRPDVALVLERVRSVLERHGDVRFAYVFGSIAKRRARKSSDVDVAVYLGDVRTFSDVSGSGNDFTGPAARGRRALALAGEMERALGREVQVAVLDDAPMPLVHNVLSTGVPILARDEASRRRFYVDHARRYYDMEHARRLFDRYRARRLREGTFGGGTRDRS